MAQSTADPTDQSTAHPTAQSTADPTTIRVPNRWLILTASIVSMVAVANFQYGWTLFVQPLQRHLRVDAALIQVTFTVFVLLETWLVPFEGRLVDRFGPRLLVILGGIMAGLGWIGSGKAESLTALYLSYAVAGIGAGIVYGTAVGSAMKWFPDHRGLAAGLTAAGFGAGSAFTVSPLVSMIASAGYQSTFIRWGIIQGVVVVVAAMFLQAPPAGWLPKTWRTKGSDEVKKRQSPVDFKSSEMAATPHFWLMYVMMVMVGTGGLMATAQLAPMATDYHVDRTMITFLGMSFVALTFALQADRLVNGLCRPFWGWISDHIGREYTMTLAFGLEAVAKFALISFASHPLAFVLLTAFTFFGWGEIFSLFPALCGDFFGRKHATENYGFLYTAKGTASVFVPIGTALAAGRAFDFRADILLVVGGLLMLFVLFLAPTVFHIRLGRMLKATLVVIASAFAAYGIIVTVLPARIKTPFSATFTCPRLGWAGVFGISIAFDLVAAALAFFVLRRMKAPALTEASQPVVQSAISAQRA
jgi:OFA family oxalate/formate antiporter-like MFS transporter